jgi:hypothetical protein
VGRSGCWCRTCTSGKARNGCGVYDCPGTTFQGFGRAPATTTTETHGVSSGTRMTDVLASEGGRRPGSLLDHHGARSPSCQRDVRRSSVLAAEPAAAAGAAGRTSGGDDGEGPDRDGSTRRFRHCGRARFEVDGEQPEPILLSRQDERRFFLPFRACEQQGALRCRALPRARWRRTGADGRQPRLHELRQ